MPDTLTTITKLIQSPPGQLAAGGVLAGIVWKFFERVEAVLTDQTKLEIAVWLLGVKVGQKLESWPDTFAKVFDRVFGKKHLTWRCFGWSSLASLLSLGIVILVCSSFDPQFFDPVKFYRQVAFQRQPSIRSALLLFFGLSLFGNVVPDYLSLLKARKLLKPMGASTVGRTLGVLALDLFLTVVTASVSLFVSVAVFFAVATWEPVYAKLNGYFNTVEEVFPQILSALRGHSPLNGFKPLWYYPAFFTSIWLWLYAGSGFLLKVVRGFDIGFDWFNRHCDIEKKPLQSIGLVAGALVAVVYWVAVIVSRVVG
jgi:hypothetical protein